MFYSANAALFSIFSAVLLKIGDFMEESALNDVFDLN